MNNFKSIVLVINLVGVLLLFNFSVVQKENLLKKGNLILLKLAPVDPRSLMQGDYMNLRYEIVQGIERSEIGKRGYVVVMLNDEGVAELVRYQSEKEPLNSGEFLINFTYVDYKLSIGAESFFFEEGSAEKFEAAEYGGLVINNEGNSLLIGLFDKNKEQIQ